MRSTSWWLGAVILGSPLMALGGCAQLLGIDGEYVEQQRGDRDAAASGGDAAVGGALDGALDSGASGGSGGTAPDGGGAGGAEPDAGGGGGQPPVDECGGRRFQGSFSGSFQSSFTVVPIVPLGVSAEVALTLGPSVGGSAEIVDSNLQGSFDVASGTTGVTPPETIGGKLQGSFDCATGLVDAVLVDASYVLNPLPPVPLDGSFSGTYNGQSSSIVGTWMAHERSAPTAEGSGEWSAVQVAL